MAFLIVVLVWLSRRPPLRDIVVPAHFHDLGNLMLAFVMLWAYFSFSQYLIIWSGNLPEEIDWYMHRLQTGWRVVGAGADRLPLRGAVLLLLSRAGQARGRDDREGGDRHPDRAAGRSVLADRAGVPPATASSVSWLDIVLPLSLGSIWLGCFIWQLRGRAILPVHDPQFDEALGRIIDARRAAEDGALAWPTCTTRTLRTDDPTTVVHHEDERRQHPRDLRLRRRPDRRRGRHPRRGLAAVPVTSTAARRRGVAPRVSARRRRRRRGCRRSRGCRPIRARTCSELRAHEDADARAATAGSTRTPASSGFRSTRR